MVLSNPSAWHVCHCDGYWILSGRLLQSALRSTRHWAFLLCVASFLHILFSIALSPALAGLFSFCSAAIQTILWVVQWRTSGLFSWLLSLWLTKIQVSGIGSCSCASGHHYKTRYCMIIDVFLQKSDVVKKPKEKQHHLLSEILRIKHPFTHVRLSIYSK